MVRILPVWTAVCVVASAGVVHALWTDRWTSASDPEAVSARLNTISLIVGDWVGETQEMDPRTRALADIKAYIMRRYVDRRTGTELSLIIVSGRGGPIAVHTPEVCFQGSGY